MEAITKCHGSELGERCGRSGCAGIIKEHDGYGCSCHINPPCGSCIEPRAFCPTCDWHEKDDVKTQMNGFNIQQDRAGHFTTYQRRALDKTKIDWHVLSHTHSSQICEGVYPEGTTREQVLEKVAGTFGGRFEHFGRGTFKYVAYTD